MAAMNTSIPLLERFDIRESLGRMSTGKLSTTGHHCAERMSLTWLVSRFLLLSIFATSLLSE